MMEHKVLDSVCRFFILKKIKFLEVNIMSKRKEKENELLAFLSEEEREIL